MKMYIYIDNETGLELITSDWRQAVELSTNGYLMLGEPIKIIKI